MVNARVIDTAQVNATLARLAGMSITYARVMSGYVISVDFGHLRAHESMTARVMDLRFFGEVTLTADASIWSLAHESLGRFQADVNAQEDDLMKLLNLLRGRVELCQTVDAQILTMSTDLGVTLTLTPDDQGFGLDYWEILMAGGHHLAASADGTFIETDR